MKALEILERIHNECEASENFMGYTYDAEKVDKIIDEAIAELEALQARIKELEEPKTCDGCKHIESKYNCCDCSRYYLDYYNPKEVE